MRPRACLSWWRLRVTNGNPELDSESFHLAAAAFLMF